MPAQTMKERVQPYVMQALAGGSSFVGVSAASGELAVAPDSLASLYGPNLAAQTASATAPYPASLGGVTVQIVDGAGNQQTAPLLYVSPEQINFVMPSGMAAGSVTINVAGGATMLSGSVQNQSVAPALFTANMNGQGVAAATAYRTVIPTTIASPVPVFACGAAPNSCVSVPIDPGVDAPVTITLYSTGIKGRSSNSGVTITIANTMIPAGSITSSNGVDMVTFPLPLSLRGSGEVNIFLTVDGANSNTARINIQ